MMLSAVDVARLVVGLLLLFGFLVWRRHSIKRMPETYRAPKSERDKVKGWPNSHLSHKKRRAGDPAIDPSPKLLMNDDPLTVLPPS